MEKNRGRTRQLYRFCPFFRPLAVVRKIPKRASRATASVSFIFRTPLALSRNFLKFLIYLCPTRVNFSTASSTTFPHQVEGVALLLGRLPPPFPFSVFPFRPGNLGLFGALLQPPAPEKKTTKIEFTKFLKKSNFFSNILVNCWQKCDSRAMQRSDKECIV